MNIAVDFDGTITMTNDYPNISELRPYVKEAIDEIRKHGHRVYLWTCRQGKELQEAIDFLNSNGIVLDGYNSCDYEFGQRKMIAELYIDDRAYPCKPINWVQITSDICYGNT